ncbi:MAG: hypothetical protein CM15mV33_020 [uncultured marine virus]|nr:MAG: hypothetical protein CM15mV33_020 [uncultured marine virus]
MAKTVKNFPTGMVTDQKVTIRGTNGKESLGID